MKRRVDADASKRLPTAICRLDLLVDDEACVVDQHVEPAELRDRAFNEPHARFLRFEILVRRDCVAAVGADLLHDRVRDGVISTFAATSHACVVNDHGRATSRELMRVCRSEPTPGTGHERNAPVEANH